MRHSFPEYWLFYVPCLLSCRAFFCNAGSAWALNTHRTWNSCILSCS